MDYQNIYKRGMTAGIEKGSAEAADKTRNEMTEDIKNILKSDSNDKIKLSSILTYLKIDDVKIQEDKEDGTVGTGESGDHAPGEGHE